MLRNVEVHILFGHFMCMESMVQPAKLVEFFVENIKTGESENEDF